MNFEAFAFPFPGQLLTALVFLPASVATGLAVLDLVLGTLGNRALPGVLWRNVGLAAAVLTLVGLVAFTLTGFDSETLGLQRLESRVWLPSFGVNLAFAIDGIGIWFLLSTAILVPLAMASARNRIQEGERAWVLATLFLETALLGALAASNLLVYVFFQAVSLVPILLWMGRWGGPGRGRAAARLWTTEALGLASLLFVTFALGHATRTQFGRPTLDLAAGISEGPPVPTLLDVQLALPEQGWLLLAFAFGLATRLPIVPLHFWLPAAHAAAPTGVSVLIATGFVQTAALGWLRFALPLFPDAAVASGPTLSVLGIVALAYASLVALVQKELKRLVAYASVGYAGFALFGMSTLNVQGLTGAIVQLLAHGFATAGLFVLIGFLAERRGTTEVAAFGGLAKPMPVCAFFFGVMVLSLMGLPMLGGFVGDLFVLLGSLETRRTLSAFALIAMVVAASYLFWVQRRLFLGPVDEPANRGLIDLDRVERAIALAITIPIIGLGVWPNPVLRRIEPAVLELLYQMDRRSVVEPPPSGAEADRMVRRRPARSRSDGRESRS